MRHNLSELENKLGYYFDDLRILREAITHDCLRGINVNVKHYERLEHIGDAVIQMVITEHLFTSMPDVSEGTLSREREKFVRRRKQSEIAEELELRRYIYKTGLSPNFKRYHEFVEAIIGAIFVDAGKGGRGYDKVTPVIFRLWKIEAPSRPRSPWCYCTFL